MQGAAFILRFVVIVVAISDGGPAESTPSTIVVVMGVMSDRKNAGGMGIAVNPSGASFLARTSQRLDNPAQSPLLSCKLVARHDKHPAWKQGATSILPWYRRNW